MAARRRVEAIAGQASLVERDRVPLTPIAPLPSQQPATLSAANDQDFKPFWLRHELPPCTTLKERSDRCRVSGYLSCPEFSERVVSRVYSVRLDQPSHRRRHRGSRQSSSWPYRTKGTRCGWRDPPAGLRGRSGGMH